MGHCTLVNFRISSVVWRLTWPNCVYHRANQRPAVTSLGQSDSLDCPRVRMWPVRKRTWPRFALPAQYYYTGYRFKYTNKRYCTLLCDTVVFCELHPLPFSINSPPLLLSPNSLAAFCHTLQSILLLVLKKKLNVTEQVLCSSSVAVCITIIIMTYPDQVNLYSLKSLIPQSRYEQLYGSLTLGSSSNSSQQPFPLSRFSCLGIFSSPICLNWHVLTITRLLLLLLGSSCLLLVI